MARTKTPKVKQLRWNPKPSKKAFTRLLQRCKDAVGTALEEAALAAATKAVEGWDDELRAATIYEIWPELPEGDAFPWASLVRSLVVSHTGDEQLKVICEASFLQHVTHLTIYQRFLSNDALQCLAQSEQLSSLVSLVIEGGYFEGQEFNQDSANILASSALMGQLTTLQIPHIDKEGARVLSRCAASASVRKTFLQWLSQAELRELAATWKIKGRSKMKSVGLIEAIGACEPTAATIPQAPKADAFDGIAALRALLSEMPSRHAFERIVFFFAHWEDVETRSEAIAYARQHLTTWDLSLCRTFDENRVENWPCWPENRATLPLLRSHALRSLYGRMVSEDNFLLDGAETLAHLEELFLGYGSYAPLIQNVAGIADTQELEGITSLGFFARLLPEGSTEALLGSRLLQGLTSLTLHPYSSRGEDEDMGLDLGVLLSSPGLEELTTLRLLDQPSRDASNVLFRTSHLSSLAQLALPSKGLHAADFADSSGASALPSLRHFAFLDDLFSRDGDTVQTILNSPLLMQVESLTLRDTRLSEEHVEMLADSLAMDGLKTLSLQGAYASPECIQLLHEAPFQQVRKVVGMEWTGGWFDRDRRGWTSALSNTQDTTLQISAYDFDDTCAMVLADQEATIHLQELHIKKHAMSSKGFEAIASSPSFAGLTWLYIDGIRITEALTLLKSTTLPTMAKYGLLRYLPLGRLKGIAKHYKIRGRSTMSAYQIINALLAVGA